MEWIHCNKCFVFYKPSMKLFLTECGHIFCERCVQQITNDEQQKCRSCNKSTRINPLTKDMDYSILQFFMPMDEIFKKTSEICHFQVQQLKQLVQNQTNKYQFAKNEYMKINIKNLELVKENKSLRSLVKFSGGNPFNSSTPTMKSNSSQAANMSLLSSIYNTPLKARPGYAQRVPNISVIHSSGSGGPHNPSPALMSQRPNYFMPHRVNEAQAVKDKMQPGSASNYFPKPTTRGNFAPIHANHVLGTRMIQSMRPATLMDKWRKNK